MSQQNTIQGLQLLEGLAQLTQQGLNSEKKLGEAKVTAQQALQQLPQKRLDSRNILNSALDAKDKTLLEALLELRQRKPTFRRTPGIFAPILRSHPT